MKLLSKACGLMSTCPGIYDPEDGSGELIVTGRLEDGTEASVRISRDLLKIAIDESES